MAFDLSTAKPAASGGFDLSTARPASEIPAGRSVGGFVSNIPSSARRLAEGIGGMVMSPIDTASGILDIGAGALQNVLPKAFVDFVNKSETPEALAAGQRAVNAANAMGGFFKERYGSWDKIKTTLYNDPVGAAADLSILFTGGGAAAMRVATASRGPIVAGAMAGLPGMEAAASTSGALSTVGKALSTAGKYTNPLNAVMPVAGVAGKMALAVPGVQRGVDVTKGVAKKVASTGYNLIEPALPGGAEAIKNRAIISAFSTDPIKGTPDIAKMNQAIAMLEQGMSIEQVAVALNSPGLAAMAKTSQNANTALAGIYAERAKAVRESQANQLAGASTNLNALSQANLPPSAGSPNLPRQAVNTALSQEQNALAAQQAARTGALTAEQQAAEATLAQQQGQLTASVANPRQMEVGDTLTKARADLESKARKEVVTPAYDAAFKASAEPFSFAPVEAAAKKLAADPSTQLNPQYAPYTAEALRMYGSKVPEPVPGAPPSAVPPAPVPAMVTLEEADKLIKALNIDLASLRGATDPASNMTLKNLMSLKSAAEQAITNGVSKEAATLYKDARTLHKEKVVEPFLKGWVANLKREGATGTPILAPSKVTQKILSSEEDALRAVAAFGESPVALQAIKAGVEGEYRAAVVSGGTSHTKWMADHQFELAALDKAGLGLTQRLESLGGSAQKLAQTAAELKDTGKAIPGKVTAEFEAQNQALAAVSKDLAFKNVSDLRKSVVENEATMNQVLRRLNDASKAALARGVMQDVKTLAELTANERPIMAALRAADPATAARIMANAKEAFRIRSLIKEAQKARPANALGTEQRVADLTQGLPQVRAAVQKIQAEINQSTSFDKLASKGVAAGGGVGNLATEASGPALSILSHTMSMINFVMRRLKGLTDDKLAAQIGVELANSPSAAALIAKAQAKVTAPAVAKPPRSWSGSIAPGALMLNQLAPEDETPQIPTLGGRLNKKVMAEFGSLPTRTTARAPQK
jgi:hypothetical protein